VGCLTDARLTSFLIWWKAPKRVSRSPYQNQQWGPVRILHNWNLLLIEQGLAVWLWHPDSPALGYKLAADYCQHYDSRFGKALSGPGRTKIEEIVRFMFIVEALEHPSE
jgi:hypothetical protein